MFNAVIFDFDGVILDSEPLHYEACCAVLKKIGLTLSFNDYKQKYLGLSDKEMFPKLLADKEYKLLLHEINELIKEKIQIYIKIITTHQKLPFVKGLKEFINRAINERKKLAICTSATKNEISTVLSRFPENNIQNCFDAITTVEDVQNAKPSPEAYLLTAARLQIPPKKCLVIEDSAYGIEAAKTAGMYVVALPTTTGESNLLKANKIVTNFYGMMD